MFDPYYDFMRRWRFKPAKPVRHQQTCPVAAGGWSILTSGTACGSAGGAGRRRSMDNWISVKDQLPKEFVPVLVCRRNRQGGQIVEAGQRGIGGWWLVYGTRTKSVTHWMPMPDPPVEADSPVTTK